MAIDIRAIVTCSLGTLISGSISDDYIQGNGLVKIKGSVEISGTITPAIGTVVTFSYVKGGVTRSIPRKLRVMSSFADPFRRTTKVELGCKLTYLSDLQEPVKWDAFDDPENTAYDEEDARIVTLPIYASSAMDKCLTELGITSSSNPLTNKFSIAKFDFGGGYVQVLNDLLVSESYCGYLDTSEVLQVFFLDQDAGTGPVFAASDIVDLGPIGVGQLPGEAVTVSYNTVKLKQPDPAEEAASAWELELFVGVQTTIIVSADLEDGTNYTEEFSYIPFTRTQTFYDSWDRVTRRLSTSNTIGAEVNSAYIVALVGAPIPYDVDNFAATQAGRVELYRTVETLFVYEVNPSNELESKPDSYDKVKIETEITREPMQALLGAANLDYDLIETNLANTYYYNVISSIITQEYIEGSTTEGLTVSKVITKKQKAYIYTQSGQQDIAERTSLGQTLQEIVPILDNLIYEGAETNTRIGRYLALQTKPSDADVGLATYSKDGDPNNGWRTESTASLELALGSATAQRRIEFSLPYAPDDTFSGPSGGPFTATASDAPVKANRYGRVQNRLLLGNRSGINLQLAPERLPAAPFEPLYVQANGLTAQYRANGTSWTFDSNGIVASVDALFWSAVGGTGTFWFPVAPGVTTLPTTPAIVSGTMTPTTVVLPYNETAIYEGRLRLISEVTKFEYALTLLTVIPAIVTKVKVAVVSIYKVEVPAASITIATAIPAINTGAAVVCPTINTTVSATAPSISV